MSFQWLEMRIQEEQDRREREAQIRARLPEALQELFQVLTACVASYTAAFGPDSADISMLRSKIRILVRDPEAHVEITADPALPGFRVTRGDHPALAIVVGLLPGDRLFYRDEEQYITIEELSRRILDRAMFPKLAE